jgi:shikimate kinase
VETAGVAALLTGCGGCTCAASCASAGKASTATAALAMRSSLVRITLGDIDLDRPRRPLFGKRGEEQQRSDHEQYDDDQHGKSGHGGAFAERGRRCIVLPVTDLTKRLDRPVVLVGLMGVGKSTVGRRLAKRLGLPFIDSDSAIEDASGLSAAEVYERFGEKDFRDGERRLVARLVEGEVRVIATGGGAYVDPRTRRLLNERAITVWLDAPVEILAERTLRRDTRAQLRQGDPKLVLERLSEERRPSYAEAHIHVRSGDGAHKDVVDAIVAALDNYLPA